MRFESRLMMIGVSGVKLLIVDNSPPMRRLLRSVASSLTDTVTECGDGAEAVRLYEAEQPDWVLMDVEMPIMDGIAATRAIMAADPNARVLIVTQYREESVHAAAHQAGAQEVILKDELWKLQGRFC